MRRLLAILAVGALLVTSCASRQVLAGDGVPSPTEDRSSTAADPRPSKPVREPGVRGTDHVATSRTSPTPTPLPSGLGPRSNMPLAVTIDKTCVMTGDVLAVTVATERRASVAFTVAYPDNSIVPDYHFISKDDNATGSYVWRFAVRSAKKGDSFVSVVASKAGRGASYNVPFVIATAC